MTKYHFIGIKGSGMSALAQVLHDIGHNVQGSDVETMYFTQKPLEQKGIDILPFSKENITDDLTVIASPAFAEDHVEIQRCRELNVPFYRYFEYLGNFTSRFTSIAVTGSHGKTSTTGLLSHTLKECFPTSYLIGDGTGKGMKESRYFVFEACEYRRHFLAYEPDYAIITNIDFDHPDYFKDVDDVIDAFQSLANQVRKKIVACGDDPNVLKLHPSVPLLTYGLQPENDVQAVNVRTTGKGVTFDVQYRGKVLSGFSVPMYGTHNVLNALAVIGIGLCEGLSIEVLQQQLSTFQGVKRRFTEKRLDNNILIDDYAHHPTEIKATIEAVREKYPQKRIVSIFQPHTYTRTQQFLDDFAMSLKASDEVYLCDIFSSAREQKGDLTIHDLLEKVPSSKFISEESVDQLRHYSDAILLFMGAGDIQNVQQALENRSVV